MKKLKRLWRELRFLNHKIKKRIKRGLKSPNATKERKRIRKKIEWLKDHQDPKPSTSGVAKYGDKEVAAWMIPWLERSRKAGWTGYVTSGYRSPEYSESLCQNMCGAPSCRGRCAGRSSNHSGSTYPAGAVDVTDYTNFERIQFRIGSPLRNELDYRDEVHFSVSGR